MSGRGGRETTGFCRSGSDPVLDTGEKPDTALVISDEISTDRRQYERLFYERGYTRVAGVDEVGRGPLAGPVVACAVVLPPDFHHDGIDDSKALSAARRLELLPVISDSCLAWAVGIADSETIDRINILRASLLAMRLAVEDLPIKADAVIVDGNHRIPELRLPQMPVVKGDKKSISVACASILAKEIRDRLMEEFDSMYPGFEFAIHKGYGTVRHLEALARLGLTPIHRRTFRAVRETCQQSLELS